MKSIVNYTSIEERVKRMVTNHLYSTDYLVFGKEPVWDRRFNVSKRAYILFDKMKHEVKSIKVDIMRKRGIRLNRKFFSYDNVLYNPLVVDFTNNKSYVKSIHDDRIVFEGGRNHWVKNEFDVKVLQILKKHFKNK